MSGDSVEQLRAQLRERGYLSHGIERWFALDPWRSRTFWVELAVVCIKAAVIIGAFAALPPAAVMLLRNWPLAVSEIILLVILYGAAGTIVAGVFVAVVALLLKIRPALAIDTPRALLAISMGSSALLAGATVLWWYGFETDASIPELIIGTALIVCQFLVATIVISAALLAFSVYELQRVPAIHSRSRTRPMAAAAAGLLVLLVAPAWLSDSAAPASAPLQIVTTPTTTRVALVAVDGLTSEILQTRRRIVEVLPYSRTAKTVAGRSTTERWATVGTGTAPAHHGVHAVEGVQLRGGPHVLQSVSYADPILRSIAPLLGVAQRRPLPPTVRRRDFIWEVVANRGVRAVSSNWWTTESASTAALTSIGQETIFRAAGGDPLAIDRGAVARLQAAIRNDEPRLATVYLPALDVILNRVSLDESARLAASVRALDGLEALIVDLRAAGYEVILAGLPGDVQRGEAVVASNLPLGRQATPVDLAPTILTLLGFPASQEMTGDVLADPQPRIASYGPRRMPAEALTVDEEYYESLKSLGYIK